MNGETTGSSRSWGGRSSMNDGGACYKVAPNDSLASETTPSFLTRDDSDSPISCASGCSQQSKDQQHLIDQLRSEQDQLRQSTRMALEKSWREVESLQQMYAEEAQRSNQLERDLEESRRREESWRKKYEDTRTGLLNEARRRSSLLESFPDSTTNRSSGVGDEHATGNEQVDYHSGMEMQEYQGMQGGDEGRKEDRVQPRQSAFSKAAQEVPDQQNVQNVQMMKSFQFSCEDWAKFLQQSEAEQTESSTSIRRNDRQAGSAQARRSEVECATKRTANGAWRFSLKSVLDNNKKGGGKQQHRKEVEDMKRHLETSLAALELEKDATIAELEEKVSSRDSVIEELDKIAAAQEDDLYLVAHEMEKIKNAFGEREGELTHEVAELRGKVHEKKALIMTQVKRFEECQSYIQELTTELERIYREQDNQTSEQN